MIEKTIRIIWSREITLENDSKIYDTWPVELGIGACSTRSGLTRYALRLGDDA